MSRDADNQGFLRKLDNGFADAGGSDQHVVVCAISGGIDSTALLLGTTRFKDRYRKLYAAHYNHRARGQASDMDEEFVRSICTDADIPLSVGSAKSAVQTLDEDSARAERYRFLIDTADKLGADAIITAHTLDDQAETVLFRITRGAGIRGAGAMRPVRTVNTASGKRVNIVRPMLAITRYEAEQFLNSRNITARHDASNDDWVRYSRNRIRHRVMPELQAINSQAAHAIARFAGIIRETDDALEQIAQECLQQAMTEHPNTYDRQTLASLHSVIRAAVLTNIFNETATPNSQLNQTHIVKLLELISSGKSSEYRLPGGVTFRSDHQHIQMLPRNTEPVDTVPYPRPICTIRMAIPGRVDLGDGYWMSASVKDIADGFPHPSPDEAWLAPSLISSEGLIIRNRHHSDRFNPLGMPEEVDLSAFLIKSKIPATWRNRIPMVVAPQSGHIAWLPRIRPAEWAKHTPQHRTALHLRLERENETA